MKTEAILLTLVGLISIVGTSPTPTLRARDAAMAGGDLSKVNQTSGQDSRLQHLLANCSESHVNAASCSAYRDMMTAAKTYKVPDVEHIISEELARTLTQSEEDDFCAELSKTLKHLPHSLTGKTLKQLGSIPACVKFCYNEDDKLKEVCQVLFVGYKQIQQTIGKEEPKQLHPMMQVPDGDKVGSIKKRPGYEKIVPAVAKVSSSAEEQIKNKPLPVLSNETEKSDPKTDVADGYVVDSVVAPNAPSDDGTVAKKEPEENAKGSVTGEVKAAAPKDEEKNPKDPVPAPAQVPQVPVVPEKNDGDSEQEHQDIMDSMAGDRDDEPMQPAGDDGKDETPPDVDASREDDYSPEKTNNNLAFNGEKQKLPEKVNQAQELPDSSKASDIVPGVDPFYEQKDSNFFSYFLFAMFSCAMLYVGYHNKSKLLALVVEGRRTSSGRGGFSKGRKHTAAYRKLDSNLEEAITSGSGSVGHSSSQIIY